MSKNGSNALKMNMGRDAWYTVVVAKIYAIIQAKDHDVKAKLLY